RRRRDAVLPRAGLRDDPLLAHADGEQRLAERVVDLVRAGVREILALQEDARAAGGRGQALRLVERRRAPDVVPEPLSELGAEAFVCPDAEVRRRQFLDRRDERLGDEASAIRAVVAAFVGIARAENWTVCHLSVPISNVECRMLNAEEEVAEL